MTQTQIELKFIKSSQLRLLLIFEEYKSTLFVFPTVIANWVLFYLSYLLNFTSHTLQGSSDDLMHIIVPIMTKTSTKYNILLLFCEAFISSIEFVVTIIVHWIIRLIASFPGLRILTCNNCFRLCTKFKMFVLDDSSKWCFTICVVHNCIPLIVFHIQYFCLKSKATIFQFTKLVIKKLVNHSCKDNLRIGR